MREQGQDMASLPLHLPVLFVDLIPKAHCAHDGQFEVDVALLQVVGTRLELDPRLRVRRWVTFKLGVEQGVHEGGLTKASFPCWKKKKKELKCFVEY